MINKFLKIAVLVLIVGLVSIVPILRVRTVIGPAWQGVMPSYATDGLFYFMQIVKGTGQIPFGNTPFFIEHANDINATPSIAPFLAAIPLKLGLSFTWALILGLIVWNSIFVYLLAVLLEQLGVRRPWVWCLVVPVYLEVYWVAVRPAVMETVFPFFVLFLITLVGWLKEPKRSLNIFLAVSFAFTFYIYFYTWQVSSAIMGLLFLRFIFEKNWVRVRLMVSVGLISSLFAFPAWLYFYREISHPMFSEVTTRLAAIPTHLPSLVSFQIARWIIWGAAVWYAALFLMPKLKENADVKRAWYVLGTSGLALFILLLSPVLTGRDAVIGNHVSRETYLWLALSASVLLYYIWTQSDFRNQRLHKKIIIVGLVALNFLPVAIQYKRSILPELIVDRVEAISIQRYATPIAWLNKHESKPVVVWANPELSNYILINSRHYVLMPAQDLANQYFVLTTEIQERYLMARYFQNVVPALVNQEYYIPFGPLYENQLKHLTFQLELCRIFKLEKLPSCEPSQIDVLNATKDRNIRDLITENTKTIRPHIYELLKKYRVAYAIKDLSRDQNFHVETLKGAKEVYREGDIIIYRLSDH